MYQFKRLTSSKIFLNRILIIILGIISISCANSKLKNNSNSINKLFAEIDGETYKIAIDTVAFKRTISQEIFSKTSKINFDKIEVKKQLTVGEEKKVFYYVLLTDFKQKTKTCRWLNRVGDELYFNDNLTFEQLYLSCSGNENCLPNVFILNSERGWICGESPSCSIKEGKNSNCIVSKSIITE